MNERIKELAKQADNYAYNMNPEQDSYGRPANPSKFQQDRDTKFAELIVRECIGHCEDARFKQTNTVPKEYANRRINMCILTIKEHFGVEE